MSDVFKEQIVKKEKTAKDMIIKVAVVVIIVLLTLLSTKIASDFFPVVLVVLTFGGYVIFTRLNVEYEYIFTNGELDVDIIYNRAKRKRIFSGDARSFEVMAHVEDKGHVSDFNMYKEIMDCSSGKVKNNTYAIAANYKGKKVKLIIEPNEAILAALTPFMGQRKFLKV